MKVAWQFTARDAVKNDPSRRVRSELICSRVQPPMWEKVASTPNHTVPYGTGPFLQPKPGSKLPGYLHFVPSGQRALSARTSNHQSPFTCLLLPAERRHSPGVVPSHSRKARIHWVRKRHRCSRGDSDWHADLLKWLLPEKAKLPIALRPLVWQIVICGIQNRLFLLLLATLST